MDIKPFAVNIPDHLLEDMRHRLRTTRWADDFGNSNWSYGIERGWLEDMVHYWANGYDWRAQEAASNRFAQFKTVIDGVPIHFIHVKGKGAAGMKPMPLILTHGWPWTFWDWKDVIAPLADPVAHGGDAADAFDVIIPSLPGYGSGDVPGAIAQVTWKACSTVISFAPPHPSTGLQTPSAPRSGSTTRPSHADGTCSTTEGLPFPYPRTLASPRRKYACCRGRSAQNAPTSSGGPSSRAAGISRRPSTPNR